MSDSESENAEPKPRIQRGEILPVIFGFGGTALNPLERSLFERFNPFGFILFKRNCKDPDQVRWLIKELKYTVARDDIPILIDQEGGRVARLGPPHWPKHPPARFFGRMFEEDPAMSHEAMQIYARLVARELHSLGINVNCAPVVDLFMEGASQAIGDRALSRKPAIVAELARTCAETFLSNGIIPVIKHLPGHGRVRTDPHDMLPVIEASRAELETEDFVPFELLKDIPAGMNSHAVFMAIDSQPASMSAVMHQDIIRGHLGFDGLLFSDDLTMKALHGAPGELARRAIEAGADVAMHCSGSLNEMEAIAEALQPISSKALARWKFARSMVKEPQGSYNPREDMARLDVLLGAIQYDFDQAIVSPWV